MTPLTRLFIPSMLVLLALVACGGAQPTPPVLQFDGQTGYVEIPDSPDLSVGTTGAFTVAAWLRPDAVTFPATEGSGYVYWLGKGETGRQEWALRLYSADNTEERDNRISFYVFNPRGGLGIGSYFQDSVTPGEWIHVVATADGERTAIYKNGVFRRCDRYWGAGDDGCQRHPMEGPIVPQHGTAPVRLGTRDLRSFFGGSIAEVRIWNRALSTDEVADLYTTGAVPPAGLVAEYLLHEGSGAVAHDSAGMHDGVIVGATWIEIP